MNITPRTSEVDAVVELLESSEYDDAKSLAKDIIKRVWSELEKRDFYAALYRYGSGEPTISYGPFSGEGEATRFLKGLGLPKPARLLELKLYSVATQLNQDATNKKAADLKWCTDCHHPVYTHQVKGFGSKCSVGWCSCMNMKEAKAA